MLVILFGKIGSGKTFAGKLLEKEFGFYFYDGDQAIPQEMQQALLRHTVVTDKMRDTFFKNLSQVIEQLVEKYTNIAVAQTYIKQKYRDELSARFPDAQFILVDADQKLRLKRIHNRPTYALDPSYIKHMDVQFDPPSIPHVLLENHREGTKHISKQLHAVLIKEFEYR